MSTSSLRAKNQLTLLNNMWGKIALNSIPVDLFIVLDHYYPVILIKFCSIEFLKGLYRIFVFLVFFLSEIEGFGAVLLLWIRCGH